MDGPFHYRQSERLLAMIENASGRESRDEIAALLWLSRIHAELATAAALIEQASPGSRWREALAARVAPEQGDQVVPHAAPETTSTTTTKRPRRRAAKKT